ncbi:hypothetical protein [Streptomyces sp. NPDC051704]|uniref:hypothetical protein n=1 Tax=Streptomyces sp. NPDC051704 TaxID=3365671 RepID=UPI0037891BCA
MSGTRRSRTGIQTTLFTVPLVLGLLGAGASPAGAAAPPGPRPATSLTCRGPGWTPGARVRYRAAIPVKAPLRRAA